MAAARLTVSSVLILALFSLCCLQACGAGRLLMSVDTHHSIGDRSLRSRSLHRSSEDVDEVRETVNSTTLLPEAVPSFAADERRSVRSQLVKRAAGGEGAMGEAKHGGAGATAEDSETSEEGGADGERGAAAAGAVRTQSMGTVSWEVPRDPHRGHPSFNIDYDAPRTHPPSHN